VAVAERRQALEASCREGAEATFPEDAAESSQAVAVVREDVEEESP
jgi:hypothetical protein